MQHQIISTMVNGVPVKLDTWTEVPFVGEQCLATVSNTYKRFVGASSEARASEWIRDVVQQHGDMLRQNAA
jgi:hypothetical protein